MQCACSLLGPQDSLHMSYVKHQNTNHFHVLVKEYVILDVHMDPIEGLQSFQIYEIRICVKNESIYMCKVPVFLKLRICFFLAEGQGVPGDEVLLPPEPDSHAEQNP